MAFRFKPRILILPIAAIVIGLLVWFKATRPPQSLPPEAREALLRRGPAITFKLHDLASQPFRLERYAGRHKLVVVFFDPEGGVAGNAQLQILKAGYQQLTAHGEKVVAISNATPYANRESVKRAPDYVPGAHGEVDYFPFHVLSDADFSVATAWGCLTRDTPPRVNPSAFIVDRAAIIHWSQIGTRQPIPVQTLLRELQQAR